MTREEAIEYLHKLFMKADITDAYGDMDDTEPYETAIDMAIEALKAQQWIPCSERLPEDNKAVLGYAPKYNNIWAVHMTANGEWMVWMPGVSTRYNEDFNGEIVKWMPLPPSPYKGEEE